MFRRGIAPVRAALRVGGVALLLLGACRTSQPLPAELLDATTRPPPIDSGAPLDAAVELPATDSSTDAATSDHEAGVQPVDAVICDGSDEPRLARVNTPSSRAWRGTAFLGWFPLLYITGNCDAFVAADSSSDLRQLHLSDADIKVLAKELRVRDWGSVPLNYCNNQIDGDGRVYLAGKRRITERACTGPSAPEWFVSLRWSDEIKALYARAAQVKGPVWYTLGVSDFNEGIAPAFRNAEVWPFGNPSAVASNDLKQEPPVNFARQRMAEYLRGLRSEWLLGDLGVKATTFVPVLGEDGVKYELRVRDATPIDDDAGVPLMPVQF
ncbi:MAG TPA: hypothetical protein VFG30_23430 [Polyangiales bacterium]|nr:hypothetical protein [Polyangiales bacterium]